MMRKLLAPAFVALLAVAGCGNERAVAHFDAISRFESLPIDSQKKLIDQYASDRSGKQSRLPMISSQAELARLADIFAQACIDGNGGQQQMLTVASANGFTAKGGQDLNIRIHGYSSTPQVAPQDRQPITDYALERLKDSQGRYPVLEGPIGFKSSAGNTVLTNGRADLGWGQGANSVCTLTVRLASDDAALGQLQRVVTSRGIAAGAPADTGLFGAGYILDRKTFITLGRSSPDAPTNLNVTRLK